MQSDYARFKAEKPGFCIRCGSAHAYAWTEDGVVETTWGSDHEMLSFVWLGRPPASCQRPGYLCDDCIGMLVVNRELEAFYCDLKGPLGALSDEASKAAYELGVRRMSALINLDADAEGWVGPEAFTSRTAALRGFTRKSPVQIRDLVAEALGFDRDGADPESRGRYDTLIAAAFGRPISGRAASARGQSEDKE